MNDSRDPGDLPELSSAYRHTVVPDAAARARLMARVRSEPPPRRGWVWISAGALSLEPWAAAALAGLLLVTGYALSWIPRPGRGEKRGLVAAAGTHVATGPVAPGQKAAEAGRERIVEFVLVTSHASSAAVVGDFNDWDPSRTPMRRVDPAGTWVARVPLPEGRRVYAFVVDGDRWVADPGAPLAPADEFGAARSVVVVGGNGSGI